MGNQSEIKPTTVAADQPRGARRSIVRRNLLLILFVALVALSPALAGCYHDDERTPTETGDGGNGDGGGY